MPQGCAPDYITCGFSDRSGGYPDPLPTDDELCDLVLVRASGSRSAALAEAAARGASVAARARLVGRLRRLVGALISRGLGLALLSLLALLFGAMVALWLLNRQISFGQAAYVTLLNAVGGASASLDLSGPEQLIQSVVALTGIAVVPGVTAVVVQAVGKAAPAGPPGARRGR